MARGRPGAPAARGGSVRTSAEKLPLFTRLWATPVYRLIDDPDGRPLRLRLKKEVLRPPSACRASHCPLRQLLL